MATVAPIGVLDLSFVTQTLLGLLGTYMNTTAPIPMSIVPSGSMPDAVRQDSGPQLTFSLFHVVADKFLRNSPILNSRAQTLPFQPMALDLYYLLSCFAQKNWEQEQQAMTLAMQFFYQSPIITMAVTLPGIAGTVNEEFSLTMEVETADEMSRLWQAISFPLRLSVVYKVSVVLLTPPATPPLAPQVKRMQLAADPTLFPYSQSGQLLGAVWTASFASPLSSATSPEIVNIDYSPAVVPLGQRFFLYGANLNQPTSSRVYLLSPDGLTENEVTTWMTPEPDPLNPHFQTASRITLDLPATLTALPAGAQSPGVYQLRAGSQKPSDPSTNRTNSVPFSIAAFIDTSAVPPPNPPILVPDVTGTYTLNGEGFVPGQTEILLDTVPSQFTVVSAAQATFQALGFPSGRYTVRVRVNGVESPPSWWIKI
jgi:Pvc16 N-terminal domain